VALSFVQTADDVQRAIDIMRDAGRSVPVIAKIERPAAVSNIDAILDVAQGVMVARGDLGWKCRSSRWPRMQKHIIRRARRRRPSFDPGDTGARVDARRSAADAGGGQRRRQRVDEGADAIMLAGETAVVRPPGAGRGDAGRHHS
jgi:pyruvate kinase